MISISRRTWPLVALLPVAIIGAAGILYGTRVGRHRLHVHEIDVDVPGLPGVFEGYRIVQLSDFHVGGKGCSYTTLARAVNLAQQQHGDMIALTGDFVENTRSIAVCADLLRPLSAVDGVLAVLGNHDFGYSAIRIPHLVEALQQLGIRVLRNESYRVQRGGQELWIVGLDDAHSGHDHLPRATTGVPAAARPILLSHYPDIAWRLAPNRWALVLSGHTHGSQIRLPLIGRYARHRVARTRFSHGIYSINRTPVFVHSGLGTSGRPIRIMSRPEVVTIRLHAAPARRGS